MNELSDYEPLLLSTQELVYTHWPQVEKLLATAPVMAEYTNESILQAALTGQMFIFVLKKDTEDGPDIALMLLMAPINYPKLGVMALITVAGRGLRFFTNRFFEFLRGWCYLNGVRAIDAYVPERLEPILKQFGFARESIHVRATLSSQ